MFAGEWRTAIVICVSVCPHETSIWRLPSLNLRLLSTRALNSVTSSPRFTNLLSAKSSPAVALAACAALLGGTVAGIHAEARPPVANVPVGSAAFHSPVHLSSERYELRLHHLHTGEYLDVVYRIGDRYIPGAIAQLNHFLRDHRTQDVSSYDPREFDVLHSVLAKLGRQNSIIDVVCGYRTPWSNNFLRTRSASTGVAQHSQHMLAKAIDLRIPGVPTAKLRDVALSLQAGGVGYYPTSQFVHVDVGPVRHWSFGGNGE